VSLVVGSLPIAWLAVLGAMRVEGGVTAVDSSASHFSLVADSAVVVRSSCSSHLSISGSPGYPVTAPEGLSTVALGVVVGGRRTISLLFLVVADEEEVEGNAQDEEEDGEMKD